MALLAVACADDKGASSAGSATDSAGAAVCAWNSRADKETSNIAYPDTSATYWGISYALADGEHLELSGRFPAARYFSFVTYRLEGGVVDVLTDRDIESDPSSTNPFRSAAAPADSASSPDGDGYTITVERGEPGADDHNRIATQLASDGASSPGAPDTTGRMLLGTGNGVADAAYGSVVYRVYLPNDQTDPTGGGGLPDVRVVDASGGSTPIATCPNPGASQVTLDTVNSFDRPVQPPPPTPIFIRPQQSTVNLFPNPDNVYVATTVAYQPGRIVVVRAKAPTFPDTRHGAAITGDEQVRFWSMCTNELRKPYPVTECAPDDSTNLDAGGFFTFVISTPEDRPADTPATAGSTWLDWGSTDVPALLLLRNMLANPAFAESATNVEPGSLAADVMGDFAPRGAYCDKALFEAGGAAACGL